MIKIQIENNVFSKATGPKEELNVIWNLLSYETDTYLNKKDKKGRKIHIQNVASYFNKTTKIFMTGFLKSIKKELRNNNIQFKVVPKEKISKIPKIKKLPGTEDRDYQNRIIKKMIRQKRGVLESKTGSGKTMIFNTIIKTLELKTLILCNKKDVHVQNIKVSKEYFDSIGVVQSKYDLSWKDSNIVFSMVQTMSKIDPIEYVDHFDLIILDEAHSISKSHEKIISCCNAEWRFAFTGTLPNDKSKKMLLIGLFGDVIDGIKNEEAQDFLSPIKVQLKVSPYKIYDPDDRYQQVYENCIINNKERNEMIISDAIELIEDGLSGLIMTTQHDHGANLKNIAKEVGYDIPYISGSTSKEEREYFKKEIDNKNIPCIISNIWKEGIDIKSLNFVSIAFGHKAEERLRQIVGRVIRKHKDKEWGLVLDYIDRQKWIGSHSLERIITYIKQGWL